MATSGEMLTPKQLAARAGVSVGLVYKWCEAGQLAHVRLGALGRRGKIMIDPADWEKFLDARRVRATRVETGPTPVGRSSPLLKHLRLRLASR
jgi:Helix-turn-helix domain